MTYTTTENERICTTCGARYFKMGTWMASLLNHMVNAGEITVGEARAELRSPILDTASAEILAGWVLARSDQDDDWKAGDPVTLPDGSLVAYEDENDFIQERYAAAVLEFPAGSYNSGL